LTRPSGLSCAPRPSRRRSGLAAFCEVSRPCDGRRLWSLQQQSLEGDICVCAFCGRGGAKFFRLLFIAPKEEVILENWKRLTYVYL
jgi:hypothetical protein